MVSKPSQPEVQRGLNALRWPLRFTWLGMCFERAAYALWPLLSVVFLVLAVLMFGVHELLPHEIFWGGTSLVMITGATALGYALYKFRVPSKTDAIVRLDQSLPGRPIQALIDTQAIGATDVASAALWAAHQTSMITKVRAVKAVPAYVRLASRDPFALRYAAVIFFAVALIFGSVLRLETVGAVTLPDDKLSSGPVWEGWIDPPRYTGRPTLYLNDQPKGALSVPEGSLIILRLYGEVGALTLSETVSGRTLFASASSTAHDFKVIQDGELSIDGPHGRNWAVSVVPDIPPIVTLLEGIDSDAFGVMTLPFSAGDDYGVESGEAWITLDLDGVSRRHGLSVPPEARPKLTVSLPMPVVGDRSGFEESLVEDFSKHPWANLPVVMNLTALDVAEQQSRSEPSALLLPGRRFFDPMAAAIIEQRRDLLWSRANAQRISKILRSISHRPEDVFRNEVTQLRLRKLVERLEASTELDRLTAVTQDELAEELWTLAVELEEGNLADALERIRQAQERLNQAMRDGATNAEIAELMRELRDATEEYLKQLHKQQSHDGERSPQDGGNTSQTTQDDLQRMMDRIQELMEQGRMAEAEEALKELQEMMESMRVSEGEGQSGGSAGEQAMEGLSDTLRDQQGLNDKAFRDLQEQFNPNAQAGESDGNVGRNGGQGEGKNHERQRGEGSGKGSSSPQSNQQDNLADRQQALRDELEGQKNALLGAGTPEDGAVRDALERAGRAMGNAEQALRHDQLGQAIDSQAQALEALRDGLQSLAEALSENQGEQSPGKGEQDGNLQAQSKDPLGRGQNGDGVDPEVEGNVSDVEVYRRARDLLAEIRRRSAQGERTRAELDYLKRLIDRF